MLPLDIWDNIILYILDYTTIKYIALTCHMLYDLTGERITEFSSEKIIPAKSLLRFSMLRYVRGEVLAKTIPVLISVLDKSQLRILDIKVRKCISQNDWTQIIELIARSHFQRVSIQGRGILLDRRFVLSGQHLEAQLSTQTEIQASLDKLDIVGIIVRNNMASICFPSYPVKRYISVDPYDSCVFVNTWSYFPHREAVTEIYLKSNKPHSTYYSVLDYIFISGISVTNISVFAVPLCCSHIHRAINIMPGVKTFICYEKQQRTKAELQQRCLASFEEFSKAYPHLVFVFPQLNHSLPEEIMAVLRDV